MKMKTLARVALISALFVSSFALADDEYATGTGTGGSGMHRPGYLLDRQDHSTRPFMLDVHAVIPYGYIGLGYFPIGVGATFYIPLAKNGFIPPVNDEFGIDFGGDVVFFPGYSSASVAIWLPVTAVWKFHITDTFEAFAKLGVALRIWPGYYYGAAYQTVWPDFVGAVGLNWMFSKSVGLRAELGYPGVKIGLNFAF